MDDDNILGKKIADMFPDATRETTFEEVSFFRKIANRFEFTSSKKKSKKEKDSNTVLETKFEDATQIKAEEKTSRFKPRKKTWREHIVARVTKLLDVKTDLEKLANYYNIIAEPKNKGEKAEKAYANMTALLSEIQNKAKGRPSAFVDDYIIRGRLIAAKAGLVGAIKDLGHTDAPNVIPTLKNLVLGNQSQVGADIQKAAIQSYCQKILDLPKEDPKNSSVKDEFDKNSEVFLKTMGVVLKNGRLPEVRNLSILSVEKVRETKKISQRLIAEYVNDLKTVLKVGQGAIDVNAANIIVDIFQKNQIPSRKNADHKQDIKNHIKDSKKTSVDAALTLAKNTHFTETAMRSVVTQHTKQTHPTLQKASLEKNLEKLKIFFITNQELVEKQKLSFQELYTTHLDKDMPSDWKALITKNHDEIVVAHHNNNLQSEKKAQAQP